MHGLIFETSVYYWQDQPGNYVSEAGEALLTTGEPAEFRLPHNLR